MCGTAKELIRNIWPNNPVWVCHELRKGEKSILPGAGWFTKITHMNDSCLKMGLPLYSDQLEIGRTRAARIVEYLLILNTVEGVEKAIAILSTGKAIGREGLGRISTRVCYSRVSTSW